MFFFLFLTSVECLSELINQLVCLCFHVLLIHFQPLFYLFPCKHFEEQFAQFLAKVFFFFFFQADIRNVMLQLTNSFLLSPHYINAQRAHSFLFQRSKSRRPSAAVASSSGASQNRPRTHGGSSENGRFTWARRWRAAEKWEQIKCCGEVAKGFSGCVSFRQVPADTGVSR